MNPSTEKQRAAGRWTFRASSQGDEYFFTTPVDEAWNVVVHFALLKGALAVSRLELLPVRGETAPPSSTLFKRLRLGLVWRDMVGTWPMFRARWPNLERLPAQLAGPSPGRRGHPDVFYARWAERYENALEGHPGTPIKHLTAQFPGHSASRIRAYLDKAESLGLLDRRGVPTGKAGGRMTEKCLEVLRKNQES